MAKPDEFYLFAGVNFYALGGWHDYLDTFTTKGSAIERGKLLIELNTHDWWHVAQASTGEIVARSTSQAHGAEELCRDKIVAMVTAVVDKVYRHSKTNKDYRVIAIGVQEADSTPVVIYTRAGGVVGEVWVRPLSEFEDGRFQRVTS